LEFIRKTATPVIRDQRAKNQFSVALETMSVFFRLLLCFSSVVVGFDLIASLQEEDLGVHIDDIQIANGTIQLLNDDPNQGNWTIHNTEVCALTDISNTLMIHRTLVPTTEGHVTLHLRMKSNSARAHTRVNGQLRVEFDWLSEEIELSARSPRNTSIGERDDRYFADPPDAVVNQIADWQVDKPSNTEIFVELDVDWRSNGFLAPTNVDLAVVVNVFATSISFSQRFQRFIPQNFPTIYTIPTFSLLGRWHSDFCITKWTISNVSERNVVTQTTLPPTTTRTTTTSTTTSTTTTSSPTTSSSTTRTLATTTPPRTGSTTTSGTSLRTSTPTTTTNPMSPTTDTSIIGSTSSSLSSTSSTINSLTLTTSGGANSSDRPIVVVDDSDVVNSDNTNTIIVCVVLAIVVLVLLGVGLFLWRTRKQPAPPLGPTPTPTLASVNPQDVYGSSKFSMLE
jgi:hypothetical protein